MADNGTYIPTGEVDRRIAEIEDLLVRLPIELETLKSIRVTAIHGNPPTDHQSPTENVSAIEYARYKPKEAVLRFLLASRDPVYAGELVKALMNVIDSDASDKRRLLYSTLTNLKNHSLIEKVHSGRLRITKKGVDEVAT